MISVYAEKNLQSSFGGVPYAIAAAIFLVIGVSAFVSFLASALGAGPSGYDLDDGIVALVAFVVPGAYFAYRWRARGPSATCSKATCSRSMMWKRP